MSRQADSTKNIILLLAMLSVFIITGLNAATAATIKNTAVSKPVVAATTQKTPDRYIKPIPTISDRTVCLPCHGSEKFAIDPATTKVFVDKKSMQESIHSKVTCIQCHTDLIDFAKVYSTLGVRMKTSTSKWVLSLFTVTPQGMIQHSAKGPNLYVTANLSCRNCKEHFKESDDYFSSIHGALAISGKNKKAPMCSTCHGSHYITDIINTNEKNWLSVRLSGKQMCGNCHSSYYESYNDSYHGMRYKAGSPEAPSCWSCHDYHLVKATADPQSMVSNANIAITCGKCHKDSVESFVSYTPMIHGRQKLLDANPIVEYKNEIMKWLDDNIISKVEDGYIKPFQKMMTVKYKEYLSERDKSVTIPTRTD
jgi:hypothetical protein